MHRLFFLKLKIAAAAAAVAGFGAPVGSAAAQPAEMRLEDIAG